MVKKQMGTWVESGWHEIKWRSENKGSGKAEERGRHKGVQKCKWARYGVVQGLKEGRQKYGKE
jgi:hypothetical protein